MIRKENEQKMENQNFNPNNIQIDEKNVNHVVNNVQNSQQYVSPNNAQYSSNQNNYNQYNQRYFSDERLNNIRNDLTKFENELNDPRYKNVRLQEIKAQKENNDKTKTLKGVKFFLIFMAFSFPVGTILALVFYFKEILGNSPYVAFVKENTEKIKERFIKDFNYKYDFNLGDKESQIRLDYNNGGYENYDYYTSKNIVSGTLSDDSKFIMAGIETEDKSEDSDGKATYTDVFNGIFISITLPFKIPTKIQLEPNKNKQKYNESRLELESADFENQYDLFADDRSIAMQIFTPEVIEDIMSMTKKYKTRISLHIYEDRVLFRMYYTINWMNFYNQSNFEIKADSNTIKDYINNGYLSQSYELLMLPEVISLSITKNMKGKYFNNPSNNLGQINNDFVPINQNINNVIKQQIPNQQYQHNIAFDGSNNNYNKVQNGTYQQQNLNSDEAETKIQNNTWDLDEKESCKNKIFAIIISIIIAIIIIIIIKIII